MTIIRVKDLSLRTLIGFKPHEKKHKQDVIIQIELEVDTSAVEHNDDYQSKDFYDDGEDQLIFSRDLRLNSNKNVNPTAISPKTICCGIFFNSKSDLKK